uniref:Uncharacterized protein n=1 Tax=Panagrolaimus sp. PS1159 TaxID=55785 RepID=A0AC35FY58_9BILA
MSKFDEASSTESNESFHDRELCSFYKRIGACRHGQKCSRLHIPPEKSRSIMIRNLYRHVQPLTAQIASSSQEALTIFEEFYEEVFTEIDESYGRINQMHVCENMGEHLIGNVYINFYNHSSANRAITFLNNRYFAGLPIFAELSPVEDFRNAVCRQHDAGECSRGGFCNFLHIKHISRNLEDKLYTPSSKRNASPYSYSESNFTDDEYSSDCSSFYNADSSFYSGRDSVLTQTSFCSTSTDSSSDSEKISDKSSDEDSEKEGSVDVPRAFRIKPLSTTILESSCSSEEEDNTIDKHQQISRRLRWEVFRQKLESSLEWNDEKERQFVFTLLELT